MPMKPRDVKLAKRVALDYLVIGMVIGGAGEAVGKCLDRSELLTDRGRKMFDAARKKNKTTFGEAFSGTHEPIFEADATIGQGVIRMVKEGNVDQYAFAVGEQMAEQLAHFTDLDDIITILERATTALHNAKKEREQ